MLGVISHTAAAAPGGREGREGVVESLGWMKDYYSNFILVNFL